MIIARYQQLTVLGLQNFSTLSRFSLDISLPLNLSSSKIRQTELLNCGTRFAVSSRYSNIGSQAISPRGEKKKKKTIMSR